MLSFPYGQNLYQSLPFVLVEYGAKPIILVSTDLSMSAEEIVIAYAYRFKYRNDVLRV